ncbi:uncharacterized protein A1O9_02714 [Exophiala aquamarina CBS 119918]|uniref:Uncharacterized protein n=1 Tax=Exophiala aquamarina CBS 119918 TaxID=1182545 RepID=A0A072PM25_9EURO|nr:uncharacterized protein A1O9_02714 [Exophiala aquamarina CBS 119918]KEF61149.1 hypothetical protein A1O9_02714 [Exophiala aquamarina CBS 119918]
MAPSDTSCIFCKKVDWNEKDTEQLNWVIQNLNGRVDSRVCFYHNQKQIERLSEARNKIQQELRRRTTPVEEVKQRIYWDHFNAMRSDQKSSGGCCVVM